MGTPLMDTKPWSYRRGFTGGEDTATGPLSHCVPEMSVVLCCSDTPPPAPRPHRV